MKKKGKRKAKTKIEQNKAKRIRAEETKKENSVADEAKAEENRTDEAKAEENRAEEPETKESRAEENNAEEVKAEEAGTEEDKAGEIQVEGNAAGKDRSKEIESEKSKDSGSEVEEGKAWAVEAKEDKSAYDETGSDQETDKAEEPQSAKKKKRRWVVPLVVALLCITILLGGAYTWIGVYYQEHFLPNTEINGIDCSGLTTLEAAALLDEQILGYSLEVTGRDYATGEPGTVLGRIVPQDIQLTFVDMLGAAEEILAGQEWLLWIRVLENFQYVYSVVQDVTYDDAMLEDTVKSWAAFQSGNMLKAQDAYIGGYSEELQRYEIIPETVSTELDVKQVINLVADAVLMREATLDLETFDLYGEASIRQDDSRLTTPVDEANLWLSTDIAYDWNGNEVILDVNTIREWVTIEDGEAVLDEEAVTAFVKQQSRNYDTYGKSKSFVTTLGVEMKLNSPSYGWRTDTGAEAEELIQLIREGSTEPREPVYTHQGMVKGKNDIGDSYVEADLTNQHLYLYQDGEIVLETDFVSGRISNGNRTPEGIFGITYKTRNAVLRGENYATPVNYWMPFYGNYGMHDATWRGAFGGDIYLTNGSHGCINLPLKMAEQIYGYMFKGFPVICYYYTEPVVPPGSEAATDEIVEVPADEAAAGVPTE